ncbi:MAG: hypothetical protein K2M53_02840 [Muribaculaceae bacterium]|nr:hypothetical protein [Muribaculaceae bacterium]
MEKQNIAITQEMNYRPPRKPTLPEFGPGVQVAEPLPISPTLKALKIGEKAVFPIEQLTSIQSTKNRLCRMYSRQGWNAEVVINDSEFQVVVTRIA